MSTQRIGLDARFYSFTLRSRHGLELIRLLLRHGCDAAAVSERGEHRSSEGEHRAWLEQLAALPGLSSETGADGGLRQMLTEALGEEVHRALLTELLTQKAAEAQPAG